MRTIACWLVLLVCVAACDSRVNVETAANAGARFSSVLITVKEVWLNENATASIDDASWLKFPLEQPRTIDLAGADGAAMRELASDLTVPPGTYRQLRLFLVDRTEPLAEAARGAGATFNDQVTFTDENGVEGTLPLELADASQGIGIETELVVPVPREAVLALLADANGRSSNSSFGGGFNIGNTTSRRATSPFVTGTSTGLSSSPVGVVQRSGGTVSVGALPPTMRAGNADDLLTPAADDDDVLGPGTPSPIFVTPGATPPGTQTPIFVTPGTTPPGIETPPDDTPTTPGPRIDDRSVVVTSSVSFDAARDLTAFRLGDEVGFLLNPKLSAYDLDEVGNIRAQLDVSSIVLDAATGRPDVEVTAERLDEGLARRVEVASAPVQADGTFTLYPLPIDDGDSTTYDLVIHGPGVTTVVIRGVPVAEGAPSPESDLAFGTVTLSAADTYRANLAADASVSPRGARVQFYQTLVDDPAPFLIEQRPVDPLTGRFATDEPLSASGVVVYGTFGPNFSLVAAAPVEGEAGYSVAASAALYGDGELADVPLRPAASAASAVTFTVPPIAVRAPAGAGTIAANVTPATPGKYDSGALLVTHDGAVVTSAPIGAALTGSLPSTVVTVADVPASAAEPFERGLYRLEAWAWHSSDPQGSFTRQPVSAAADLRAAPTASADVTVN